MTVIASAAGARIDCDTCGLHATASAYVPDTLRLEAGFVLHGGRDWCPGCWSRHTEARFSRVAAAPADDGPAAA
ncbi:MAG TPA: hypothetical protein VFY91_08170 [Microbacterium sp.]|nr:hypothetical protein [Microbacterium sp.]